MGFTEVYRFSGRDSSPLLIPVDIRTADVILDFGEPILPSWLVSGTVFCLSTLPDGREVSNPGIRMSFGSTRLNLIPPSFPYRVKFVPRRGLQYYNLVLSVGSSLSVDSVDTLYLGDSQRALLGEFGLSSDISALSPQNATLLLFLLKSLKEVNVNNSTDILTFVSNLDAVIRQSEQNKTGLENQDILLTSVISKAVVMKDFTIQRAAFSIDNLGYQACEILHEMRSLSPITAVYDNGSDGLGRDLQLVQVVSKNENTSIIRMTVAQYENADFPFHCKFSDRSQVALAPELLGYAVPNSSYKARLNRANQRLERQLNGASTWEVVRDDQLVSAAKIAPNGLLHVILGDGTTYVYTDVMGSFWQGSNSGNYDSLTIATGAIIL